MHIADMQQRSWEIAEKKGLHENLDKATHCGIREQALAAMAGTFHRLTDVAQHLKRYGLAPDEWESIARTLIASIESIREFSDLLANLHAIPANQMLAMLVRLTLIHTEVSEAAEAVLAGDTDALIEELADIVIRTGDLAETVKGDLDNAVQAKILKNAGRPMYYGTPQEEK